MLAVVGRSLAPQRKPVVRWVKNFSRRGAEYAEECEISDFEALRTQRLGVRNLPARWCGEVSSWADVRGREVGEAGARIAVG